MERLSPSTVRAARAPEYEPSPVQTALALQTRKRMRTKRAGRRRAIARNYEALQISRLLIKTRKAADGLLFAPFNTGRIQAQVQMNFPIAFHHSGSTVGSGGPNVAIERRGDELHYW